MVISYDNIVDYVDQEFSSWGQKEKKNEDLISSSQVIGTNNKTSKTVTNSRHYQQKKPMGKEISYNDVVDYVDQDFSSWG